MFERLLPNAVLRHFMTPLGKEIDALFEYGQEPWRLGEYVVYQPSSGIELWIANGYSHFHIHGVTKGSVCFGDSETKHLLNRADRAVLWRSYRAARKNTKEMEVENRKQTIANLAKLAYMKEKTHEQ